MTACHPAAHHIPSLERDVHMSKAGRQLLTSDTHYLKSEILSSQKKLTIADGMGVALASPELFDLLIYFCTYADLELERRLGRDIDESGRDMNNLMQSHNEQRIQYELFMHPYSKNFDIILKSTKETIIVEENT